MYVTNTAKTESLNGVSVEYTYSACVIAIKKYVTFLYDLWFTEFIYEGF
jgi:hypothetical protein